VLLHPMDTNLRGYGRVEANMGKWIAKVYSLQKIIPYGGLTSEAGWL